VALPSVDARLGAADGPGEPEVDELGAPLVVDEHVAGLEVAVDDPGLVRGGKTPRDLLEHREDRRRRSSLDLEPSLQGHAADPLHHDEDAIDLGRTPEVEDSDDVRMGDVRECQRLALEGGDIEPAAEQLERHIPTQSLVSGAKHLAHAPRAQQFTHDVAAQ